MWDVKWEVVFSCLIALGPSAVMLMVTLNSVQGASAFHY